MALFLGILRCAHLHALTRLVSLLFLCDYVFGIIGRYDSVKTSVLSRVLKGEVEELEELENRKDCYVDMKTHNMDDFRAQADNFAAEYRARVEELRKSAKELNSSYVKLQQSTGYSGNSDLAAAEARKCELLAAKENLHRRLISNYQKRGQLQKQLRSTLIAQNEGQREGSQITQSEHVRDKR